jgi:hypothetical protein
MSHPTHLPARAHIRGLATLLRTEGNRLGQAVTCDRRPRTVTNVLPEPRTTEKASSPPQIAHFSASRGRYSSTFDANRAENLGDCDESLTACAGVWVRSEALARRRA